MVGTAFSVDAGDVMPFDQSPNAQEEKDILKKVLIIQEDKSSCSCCAKNKKKCLEDKTIKMMDRPGQSADLNPIENRSVPIQRKTVKKISADAN